ncbi:zinc finger and BTB domain-containing protein 38-like isoform X2 [Artemia franciscana]
MQNDSNTVCGGDTDEEIKECADDGNETGSIPVPTPKYQCEICGKIFAIPARLTRHYRTHSGERPWSCDVCGKAFAVKENLSVHLRVHTKERPYRCDICGRAFEHSGKLHRHRRIHTGERPHHCKICGKDFIQSGQLVIHQRSHTGEKPFICQICHKGFTCSKQLKVHQRTHTGEKPYVCKVCNKSFGYNHVLKFHLMSHYGTKYYKCVNCKESFESRPILKDHLKNCYPDNQVLNTSQGQNDGCRIENKDSKCMAVESTTPTLSLCNRVAAVYAGSSNIRDEAANTPPPPMENFGYLIPSNSEKSPIPSSSKNVSTNVKIEFPVQPLKNSTFSQITDSFKAFYTSLTPRHPPRPQHVSTTNETENFNEVYSDLLVTQCTNKKQEDTNKTVLDQSYLHSLSPPVYSISSSWPRGRANTFLNHSSSFLQHSKYRLGCSIDPVCRDTKSSHKAKSYEDNLLAFDREKVMVDNSQNMSSMPFSGFLTPTSTDTFLAGIPLSFDCLNQKYSFDNSSNSLALPFNPIIPPPSIGELSSQGNSGHSSAVSSEDQYEEVSHPSSRRELDLLNFERPYDILNNECEALNLTVEPKPPINRYKDSVQDINYSRHNRVSSPVSDGPDISKNVPFRKRSFAEFSDPGSAVASSSNSLENPRSQSVIMFASKKSAPNF